MAFTAPIFTKLRTVSAKGGGEGAGTNYRALVVYCAESVESTGKISMYPCH
jgi:hypothetical protein